MVDEEEEEEDFDEEVVLVLGVVDVPDEVPEAVIPVVFDVDGVAVGALSLGAASTCTGEAVLGAVATPASPVSFVLGRATGSPGAGATAVPPSPGSMIWVLVNVESDVRCVRYHQTPPPRTERITKARKSTTTPRITHLSGLPFFGGAGEGGGPPWPGRPGAAMGPAAVGPAATGPMATARTGNG